MLKYIFCTYDVWGDENDYEVNDIMKACADKGFLNKEYLDNIDVDHSCSPDYYEFWDLGTNLPFARIELAA